VPTDAPFTEFLTYGFDERLPSSAVAYLQWENKRIPLKIEVPNVNELYMAELRKDLRGWAGFDYQNWQAAAQFAADHKVGLDEALVWADKAINEPFRNAVQGRQDLSTMGTKAAVLEAMGRQAAADSVMDMAIRLPDSDVQGIHQYGLRLLRAGRNDRALQIFRFNRQQHPADKFVTYVGLARGYTAVGNKKEAIANWQIALRNVPADQAANRARFEQALQALQKGQ
jgi:tetratricopeptide (TPR) repeat protein